MISEEKAQHIPQFRSNISFSYTYRFVATAGATSVITGANIAGAIGGIGTTANSTVTLFSNSFKIKRIKMWAPPPTQGSSATVSCEFGQATGSVVNQTELEYSDTSINPSCPAYITMRPPKSSQSSFWQFPIGGGNASLLTLTYPIGTVIDLTVDVILADDNANRLQASSLVTVVLGNIYYLALDGPGPHNLVPVSLNTTF
jgi:hypothetical protein